MKTSRKILLFLAIMTIVSMPSTLLFISTTVAQEEEYVLTLWTGPAREPGTSIASVNDILKEEFAKIGIELKLTPDTGTTWQGRIYGNNNKTYDEGGWDIETGGWGWKTVEMIWFEGCYAGTAWPPLGWNRMGWSNARADYWLKLGNTEFDEELRTKYYSNWQKEYMKDPPEADMWYPKGLTIMNPELENVWPAPWEGICQNVQNWVLPGEDTIYIGLDEEGEAQLNPIFITGAIMRIGMMYSSLIETKLNPDGSYSLTGDLAESWEVAPDKKSVTFHLRENAMWHDGEPVTSEDVKVTFDAILDPDTGSLSHATIAGYWKSCEIIDEHTVKMELSEPTPLALAVLTRYGANIMPAHIMKDVPHSEWRAHWTNTERVVGSGPYKFVEWKRDDYMSFEAFEDYHLGTPKTQNIIWRIIPAAPTRLSALEAGEIDLIVDCLDFYVGQLDRLEESSDIKMVWFPKAGTNCVKFNLHNPVLQERLVRLAICHAIPKEKIIDVVFQGHADMATAGIAKAHRFYDWSIEPFEYDLDLAKSYLEQAGYKPTPTLTIPMSVYIYSAVGGFLVGAVVAGTIVYFISRRE